jgi:hypothetical protein
MTICTVMTTIGMLAYRIALSVKVVAAWKQVQTATQQRNGADNRQQHLGGELPKKSHKGRYFSRKGKMK